MQKALQVCWTWKASVGPAGLEPGRLLRNCPADNFREEPACGGSLCATPWLWVRSRVVFGIVLFYIGLHYHSLTISGLYRYSLVFLWIWPNTWPISRTSIDSKYWIIYTESFIRIKAWWIMLWKYCIADKEEVNGNCEWDLYYAFSKITGGNR